MSDLLRTARARLRPRSRARARLRALRRRPTPAVVTRLRRPYRWGRRLALISREERASSPVFIIGEARSGTSILYRTLQKHPSFAPREENLQESKVIDVATRPSRIRWRRPASLYRYMLKDDKAFKAFLHALVPIRPALRLAERSYERYGERVWSWPGSPLPLVVRAFFYYARRARGADRVVEKSTTHVAHTQALLRCYPRARLIYIHRHPVDVYTSYVRRAQVDRRAGWARITAEEFAKLWADHTTAAIEAQPTLGPSLLLVRYEDFTTDPLATARRLCDFLGEPFDPKMVVEQQPDLTKWARSPHLYGEITKRTKDWRDYVSVEDARALQERLRPVMERLGYAPYDV